ncbi:MAG TPA: outer membrane protein assembly factor BamD [Bacteroidia bacterium]|nr:outer membrane protein assembly factor BamD [Bacteroidia bacterium]
MKNKISAFLPVMISLFLLFASCSRFNRIQKSTDMEAKYKAAVEYYNKKNYYNALQLFEELISVYRGTSRAEETYFYYCECYFQTGEFAVAAYHYYNFNQTFPNSPKAEEALFKNAYCYYLDSPVSSLDQKNTIDAIRQFQLFINRYPESDKVPECNKLIDQLRFKLETKEFNNSVLYYNTENYKSAVVAFQNLIKSYPSTVYREESLYYILRSSWLYAAKSIEAKKAERYNNAVENYVKLIDAYPEGKFLKEAEKIYQDCQQKLKKLESRQNIS